MKLLNKIISIIYISLLIMIPNSNFVLADKDYKINALNNCEASISAFNNYEPKDFNSSNNLQKSPGAFNNVEDATIILAGKLTVLYCNPIADAKIFIWQATSRGRYPYLPLKEQFHNHNIDINTNSSFQGSAIATTNNRGEFKFVTIYPGNVENEYPNINLRIIHPKLGTMQTKLYIHNHKLLSEALEEKALDAEIELIDNKLMIEFDGYQKPEELIIRNKDLIQQEAKNQPMNFFHMEHGYQVIKPHKNNINNFTVTLPSKDNNLISY